MKMAKASQQDIDAANKVGGYINELEKGFMPSISGEVEEGEFFDRDDPDDCMRALNAILDAAETGSIFRVIFGMTVVCDPRNKVIDPDAETLEVHPEHVANAEKVDALTARLAELEKDAQRYEWLRTPPNNLNPAIYGPTGGLLRRDEYLDAAIDAALLTKEPT